MDDRFGRLIGGRLCLDFVNTLGGRGAAGKILDDRLTSFDLLLRWSTRAGALRPRDARALAARAARAPREAAAVLERARSLRESLYRVFTAAVAGRAVPAADLAVVNRELRRARAHETIAATPRLAWTWDDDQGLDSMLRPVVKSAADLLTSADLARVGQCPGEDCGWLFLDTSRSRRRQWCDMRECGNRAKVRRFRERRRQGRRRTRDAHARRSNGPA